MTAHGPARFDGAVDHQLLAFLGIATLLTITPGADMALVTRNVLRGGARAGLETSAGILCGLLVWASLAAMGIAAILAASAVAFTTLKLLGAAYLVYLGAITLWRSRKLFEERPEPETAQPAPGFGPHYRQGLFSNLLNAKVGVFYATFLPQFIAPGQSVAIWVTMLAALHLAISVAWLAFFAWFIARVRGSVSRPKVRQALDRVTGVALVGFGVRLAKSAR